MMITIVLLIHVYNYNDFTALILKILNSKDKLHQFRSSFLTHQKFIILRIVLLSITALYGSLIFFARASKVILFIKEIRKEAIVVFHNVLQEIRNFSRTEMTIVIFVFLFILGFHLFYFFTFPMFIDEAFTYVHFVSKGFLTSASYYPGPNNHIFYSELCVFTNLFFDDPIIVTRLPAFVVGLVLSILFFLALRKHLGFHISLLSIIIFSLSEQINFYFSQGRGYMLLTFFVFVSVYSLGRFLFDSGKFYPLLFVFSSVFGFYTLPIFLYPFSAMFLWSLFILWKKRSNYLFFKAATLYFLIAVLVLILYSPVLLLNPPGVIFGNTWVSSPAGFYNKFPHYILHLSNFWWFDRFGILFSLASITGLLWLGSKHNIHAGIAVIFQLFLPLVMIFIQKVLPFERVWLYYLLFLSIGLSYLIINLTAFFIKDASTQRRAGMACLIIILGYYSFYNYRILQSKTFSYYREADKFLDKIDSLHLKNIRVMEPDYNTLIRLHSLVKNNSLSILSADHIMTHPDLLIISRDLPLQDSAYIFFFQNAYVKVYKPRARF